VKEKNNIAHLWAWEWFLALKQKKNKMTLQTCGPIASDLKNSHS
jgi:hypothetical protein